MFVNAYVVFCQTPVKYWHYGGKRTYRMELKPMYVCKNKETAQRFKDSVEEETGRPAPISVVKMWEEDHGQD